MTEKLREAAQAALEELIASESNAWNVINDIEAALAETQMPTKICGPNLEETLNAAGFYKKREWVALTDDEIWQEWSSPKDSAINFARAIEAKLRNKNT